ncbi:hypothetical protein ONE63_003622 [Megalurothrips usitatus]|uniref:Uncharacterized protein n=1 Tax=Megalurothrips usitatus TaxID=439358 RepID=A0AAV7X7G2_9NEOP|nr:hypothetical protein ONE63_003622 [Megalurothrips usitatus]
MNPVRNPRVADTAPAPMSAQTSTAGIPMEATRNLESFGTSVERVRQSGPQEPPVRRPLPVKGLYYTKQQGIDFVEECLKSQPKTDEDFEKLADELFLKNGSTKNGKQLKTKWRAYERKRYGTMAQRCAAQQPHTSPRGMRCSTRVALQETYPGSSVPKVPDWHRRLHPLLSQTTDNEKNAAVIGVVRDIIAAMDRRSEAIKAGEETIAQARMLEAEVELMKAKTESMEAENRAKKIEVQGREAENRARAIEDEEKFRGDAFELIKRYWQPSG